MLRLILWLASRLSLRAARRIGALLGALAWGLGVRRRVTLENIRRALGCDPRTTRALARGVYRHMGCGAMEFMRCRTLTEEGAREILGPGALDRLAAARARGKGVLILSAHLGNWDLLACAAARSGLPVSVITREIRSTSVNQLWMAERARCGVRLLPARGSALAVVRALKRNEVVALVLDQHDPAGVVVPFFGRAAATSPTLARLARTTGAPVLPAFLLRSPGGFELRLLDEVPWQDDGAGDALRSNTLRYTQAIEAQVRRHPEQWLWLHRRWKADDATWRPAASPARR